MPPTRRQLAVKYLRRKLERGEFAPGARLSDLALSKEMGISRTPVREAIQLLVAEGVAEAKPHAGVFLKSLDRDDIRELYELREALEGYAAARVAAKIAELPEALARMRECCRTLHALETETKEAVITKLSPEKTAAQREADLRFHRILIAACGNRRIASAIEESALHTRLFATMPAVMTVTTLRHARLCHGRILRAIERGEAEAARAEMARHIQRGLEARLAEWNEADEASDIPAPLRDLVDE